MSETKSPVDAQIDKTKTPFFRQLSRQKGHYTKISKDDPPPCGYYHPKFSELDKYRLTQPLGLRTVSPVTKKLSKKLSPRKSQASMDSQITLTSPSWTVRVSLATVSRTLNVRSTGNLSLIQGQISSPIVQCLMRNASRCLGSLTPGARSQEPPALNLANSSRETR